MSEFVKGDTLTFDGNIIFMVMETLIFRNNKYVFLANVDDETDILIRREDLSDNSLEGLDNDEEFNSVLVEFGKRMSIL